MKEVKRKLNEKNDKKLLPLIKLMMKCTLALLYLLWQHLRLHSNEKRQNKHAITSIYTNTTLQIRTKSFCSKNYYSLLLFVDSRDSNSLNFQPALGYLQYIQQLILGKVLCKLCAELNDKTKNDQDFQFHSDVMFLFDSYICIYSIIVYTLFNISLSLHLQLISHHTSVIQFFSCEIYCKKTQCHSFVDSKNKFKNQNSINSMTFSELGSSLDN